MATLAQLMKFGSQVKMPDGSFRFVMDAPRSKFKWDDKRLIRKVGKARVEALRRAGLVVKSKAKREISNRTPRQLKNAKRMVVGKRFGLDLVALIDRVPVGDRVTSWKTPRHPKGMLREDIQSDYDTRTKTVVIGPSKFPKINAMHEFGGSARRWFKPVAMRTRGDRVLGILTNTPPRENYRRIDDRGRRRGRPVMKNAFSFVIRIKKRPYMARGIVKALPRIPEEFRDTVRGP